MLGRFVRFAAVGAAITAPIGAYAFVVRPWARSWGVDPTEAATVLPGDDIVADATTVETRAITIGADQADVWPWLVQMGYRRAGFYSYDRLDQLGRSFDAIVPEWQAIAAGDNVPTNPAGGFEVRIVEPGEALVLYVDSEITQNWMQNLEASADAVADGNLQTAGIDEATADVMPAGVRASGAMLSSTMPREFAGTWAFVLRRTPDGSTRLIERLRFRFPAEGPAPARRFAMGALGFGVFLMVRKQLLGVRERAERLARTKLPAPYVA